MVFNINNLTTPLDLNGLNEYLADKSYVGGYVPTKADVSVFDAIKNVPSTLANVQRWYRHIQSFSSGEKNAWEGQPIPQIAGAQPTVAAKAPAKPAAAEDDDVDLFGSEEEEDAEAQRIRDERVAAYAAKKSKKPALIAKSSVLLDVKPWDDETDMAKIEENVRSIVMDGLVWGASKLVPVGYGIKKLQIMCVIEDDKVSIDLLSEKIEEFQDVVQSVDVAAFNKI